MRIARALVLAIVGLTVPAASGHAHVMTEAQATSRAVSAVKAEFDRSLRGSTRFGYRDAEHYSAGGFTSDRRRTSTTTRCVVLPRQARRHAHVATCPFVLSGDDFANRDPLRDSGTGSGWKVTGTLLVGWQWRSKSRRYVAMRRWVGIRCHESGRWQGAGRGECFRRGEPSR